MKTKFSKSFIYTQIIFWSLAICGIGVYLMIQTFKEYKRQTYQTYISQYLEKPPNEPADKYELSPNDLTINGKLIIVDLNENQVDPMFEQLPDTLKPNSPEQIKTVLWVKCQAEDSYLSYTDGSQGIENNCELTFVDLINHKYLWRDKINILPPTYKTAGTSIVPSPNEAVLRYLDKITHQD